MSYPNSLCLKPIDAVLREVFPALQVLSERVPFSDNEPIFTCSALSTPDGATSGVYRISDDRELSCVDRTVSTTISSQHSCRMKLECGMRYVAEQKLENQSRGLSSLYPSESCTSTIISRVIRYGTCDFKQRIV